MELFGALETFHYDYLARDAGEYVLRALHFGSYSKLPEFVELQHKLMHSYSLHAAATEKRIALLLRYPMRPVSLMPPTALDDLQWTCQLPELVRRAVVVALLLFRLCSGRLTRRRTRTLLLSCALLARHSACGQRGCACRAACAVRVAVVFHGVRWQRGNEHSDAACAQRYDDVAVRGYVPRVRACFLVC